MKAKDIRERVLVNGQYVNNPTAKHLDSLLNNNGTFGKLNGQYMYVVDQSGRITIGTRANAHMPHPTLIGGADPKVRVAGIVEFRGGKIYSIDNASGHYKPPKGAIEHAKEAFGKFKQKAFSRDFKGYTELPDTQLPE